MDSVKNIVAVLRLVWGVVSIKWPLQEKALFTLEMQLGQMYAITLQTLNSDLKIRLTI
jgi:hypothetical protein